MQTFQLATTKNNVAGHVEDVRFHTKPKVAAGIKATYDASEAAAGAGIGAAVGGGQLDCLRVLACLQSRVWAPIVAAGWLASTAVGALAGTALGGIVGLLVDSGVPEEHAHVYSKAVRRGGTLLSIKIDEAQVARVQDILNRYQPIDPSVRGSEYRKTGWKGFDPDAAPYEMSETEIERRRRAS